MIKDLTTMIIRIGGKQDESMKQFSLWEKCKVRGKGSYQLKHEIEEIEMTVSTLSMELSIYQMGYINSFINDKQASNVLKLLNQDFWDFLDDRTKRLNQKQKKFVNDTIETANNSTQNSILCLFWLGIIDLDLFIAKILGFSQQRPEEKKGEVINDVLDGEIYEEEREQDYEARKTKINYSLEQVLNEITDIFSSATTTQQYFQGCQTISDCVRVIRSHPPQQDFERRMEIILRDNNMFDISIGERWAINNTILDRLIHFQMLHIDRQLEKYKSKSVQKQELDRLYTQDVISSQHIIAMTTTGRSKYQHLLENISPPIVIVEEAAEVFEAHILTALSEKTEHLILIGDHEQLKPNSAVYKLSQQYNLSLSMFERLIKNKINHATLSDQRRMRPEFANMLRFIYPNLKDHPTVLKYPKIRGIDTNIFFFDHKFQEGTHEMMASKFNIKEAEVVVRFTWYLLQQHYKPESITILTLYTGQLLQIKKIIRESQFIEPFKTIKVINVDNYQGEENEIIILSLVRSNASNQIGYLKISNRVCVALSRAKQGLYIFGNSECLKNSKLSLWSNVLGYLEQNNFIGPELILKCQNHDAIAKIQTVEDFKLVPEGGCTKVCDLRMDCGHKCEIFCHPHEKTLEDPTGHQKITCKKNCVRNKPCGHPCSYRCHQCTDQKCQPCTTLVKKLMRPCNHTLEIKCHEYESTINCSHDCEKILSCGHQCQSRCFQDCLKRKCKIPVKRQLLCNHIIEMDCSTIPSQELCYDSCNKILDCGHPCPEKCGVCSKNGYHADCKQKCSRLQVCGHQCKQPCTKNCPPCSEKCATKCSHSKCSKVCSEICVLCKEPCDNKCEHTKCTMLCSQPCNRNPCNLPCPRKIQCGHPCIGACGEECIKVCRICDPTNQIFTIMFGNEGENNARFLRLDCGHIFEVEAMDKYMEQDKESTVIKYKQCPQCRVPIMSVNRYMTQINQVLNDIIAVKAKILEQEEEFKLLEKSSNNEIDRIIDKVNQYDRTKKIFVLVKENAAKLQAQLKQAFRARRNEKVTELIDQISILSDILTIGQISEVEMPYQEKNVMDNLITAVIRLEWSKIVESKTVIAKNAKVLKQKYHFDDEFQAIFKAIGLGKGHWNKCPNGHLYVIGECGGAMQESKCPDCQSVIGGSGHSLAAGNQHASELGGRSAWDPNGFDARVARGEVNLDRIIHD